MNYLMTLAGATMIGCSLTVLIPEGNWLWVAMFGLGWIILTISARNECDRHR